MTATPDQTDAKTSRIIISVDAMGGDNGPATVVAGLSMFMKANPNARAIVHGPSAVLEPLVAKADGADRITIGDAEEVVKMTDKPSHVLRHGKKTSMWSAIDAVRSGEAAVVVSCGNTGGLMAMSMLRLRKAEGVNRPAIAETIAFIEIDVVAFFTKPRGGLTVEIGLDVIIKAAEVIKRRASAAASVC